MSKRLIYSTNMRRASHLVATMLLCVYSSPLSLWLLHMLSFGQIFCPLTSEGTRLFSLWSQLKFLWRFWKIVSPLGHHKWVFKKTFCSLLFTSLQSFISVHHYHIASFQPSRRPLKQNKISLFLHACIYA